MINLPLLAEHLSTIGVLDKTFMQMTQAEILDVCSAVVDSLDNRCPGEYICNVEPHYMKNCIGHRPCDRRHHGY